MKSTADIVTTDAARIAKRLVNHWKHKFEIEQNRVVLPLSCLRHESC